MLYRPLKYLFVFLLGLLIVPIMTIPPEGAYRDGAFSTSFLLWFLMLPLGVFLTAKVAGTNPNRDKKNASSIPDFAVNGKNRFCLADVAAIALLCWITFSLIALAVRDGGNWRYAINSFSLYFFLVYTYFLIRVSRSILSPALLLALLAAVAVICLTESFSALYAYLIRDPAFRQNWLENSDELLRNSGMFYPKGSPERILLENRILGSTEPLGTYGLANTLAGVLIPILVALSGLVCVAFVSAVRPGKRDKEYASQADSDDSNLPTKPRKSLLSFFLLAVVVFVPLFVVLILTKSRTGILAFLFGALLFGVALIVRRLFVDRCAGDTTAPNTQTSKAPQADLLPATKNRKVPALLLFAIGVVLLVGVSIFVSFRLNVIDKEVFTEAGKSLGYRLDYWRSSSAMIADYPWFGIGPGSFQTRYPSYMMPQASEVIADPHNFVFELATMFGLPAMLLFFAFLVLGCPVPFLSKRSQNGWFVAAGALQEHQHTTEEKPASKPATSKKVRGKSRQSGSTSGVSTTSARDLSSTTTESEAKLFFSGLGLGFFLAFIFSAFTAAPFGFSFLICGLLAFIAIVPLFGLQLTGICERWAQNPQAARGLLHTILLAVCGAILLNFSAAGGFSYPATALPLWMALGVLVNDSVSLSSESGSAKSQKTTNPISATVYGSILLLLVIPIVFYFVAFLPASRGEAFVRDCRNKLIRDDQPQLEILSKYPQAMQKADPYSIPVALLYFEVAASAYAQVANYRTHSYWSETRKHLLDISPLNSSIRDTIGSKEVDLCKQFKTDKLLASACDTLQDAVRLAPYDAKKHAFLAIAFEMSGKHDDAVRWGTKALELDTATPHLDRKLTTAVREEVEGIIAAPSVKPGS